MDTFTKVVRCESKRDNWDPWAEMDAKDWLAANELIEEHFAALLDDALGGTENDAIADLGEALDWLGARR